MNSMRPFTRNDIRKSLIYFKRSSSMTPDALRHRNWTLILKRRFFIFHGLKEGTEEEIVINIRNRRRGHCRIHRNHSAADAVTRAANRAAASMHLMV